MLRVVILDIRNRELQRLLDMAIHSDHMVLGIKVRYWAMVTIEVPFFRNEAWRRKKVNDGRVARQERAYLSTRLSTSGSRFKGSSTEYSSFIVQSNFSQSPFPNQAS